MHPLYLACSLLLLALLILFIWDITQKEHSLLRNFPIIGHFRYLLEQIGVYLRQYWYSRDREELPFNRAERSWVYRAAKNVDTTVSFGSTRNPKPVGTVTFINAPFAVLGRDSVKPRTVTIGEPCMQPYSTNSLFNISAMSFGALSEAAIKALSLGAEKAGCWLNTGEGGLSPHHLAGGCDLVYQIGTAKYGVRDVMGNLSEEKLKELAAHKQIKMFEIKLSQGAKPGKGGVLPAIKVTPEIAALRGIAPYQDSISPNRFPEISNCQELLDFIHRVRTITGKPTGCKFVLGDYAWLDDLFAAIVQRGVESAPDFITLDSNDGGTGAAPLSLMDYMGLALDESLPKLVDKLHEYKLRDRIKVIASGKLINPAEAAWAFCAGADFVNSARGFLLALGCIQSMRCHLNTCPTGITTHNKYLQRGLVPESKAERVYHYAKNMAYEIGIIAHSCGVHEPRDLTRAHARIMTDKGISVSMAELYPDVRESEDS